MVTIDALDDVFVDQDDEKSEEISLVEDKISEEEALNEEPEEEILHKNDQALCEARLFREQFERKYSLTYMLLFDKSKDNSKVFYFLVNPLDDKSLISRPCEISFTPIRDLLYYRAISMNNRFYTLGGIQTKSFKVSAQVFCYNVGNDEWFECESMNVARCKFAVSTINGKIYVAGGQDINGNPLASIEMYDPDVNTWRNLGNLKQGIKFLSSSELDERYLIITGGFQMKNENFFIYDTHASDWRTPLMIGDLPNERENHASVVLNGKLYLFGGIRYYSKPGDDEIEPQNENSIHSIDLKSYLSVKNNTWRTTSNPSSELDRNGCGVCGFNENIYVVGGHKVENFDNKVALETKLVECFNTQTNKIETVMKLSSEVTCFDCDLLFIHNVDPTRNKSFKIDTLLLENYHFW